MKRLVGLSALALIISSTSACSWLGGEDSYFRNRTNDYLEARQTAPMQLPEGVQAKRLDELLPIPVNVASVRGAEVEIPRPPMLVPTGGIYSDFSLQKSDDNRWIVAQRSRAEVWSLALQFFRDSGFSIAQENETTGEFVTAWQPRKELTAVLGSGKADDEDDNANGDIRIRVRTEPGVQKSTTEVFVATALRDADSGDEDLEWLTDTGVETSLLEGMLASMASNAQEAAPVSLLAERQYDTPKQVRLSEDMKGSPILTLGADYDRAWSSVGRALQTADIRVDDLNRTTGIYYIDLAKGAEKLAPNESGFFDWMLGADDDDVSDDANAERYIVHLIKSNNETQIAVEQLDGSMAPADEARKVLSLIKTGLLDYSQTPSRQSPPPLR